MEIKIKIISTEIIKPSSPTPDHLRTHKFFFPNDYQNVYLPIYVFYTAKRENPIKNISSHLKNSLSKTLTYYYPLAGQIQDGVWSDCNDHGATFIETQVVAGEMSELLQRKDNNMLRQLLPLNGNLHEIPTTYHANLVVQVNYFGCGGIAISISFIHNIVDASTASYFVKSWAEVARGGGANGIKDVIVDYSSIRRPYDELNLMKKVSEQNLPNYSPSEIVTKVFTFDGRKIAALREKIGNGAYLDRPASFEAISALILGTLIKNNGHKETVHEFTATQIAAVFPFSMRDKVNPPLPPQCIGNLVTTAIAKLPIVKKIDYNYLAAKTHESTRKVIDKCKRNVHMHGGVVVEADFSNSIIFFILDATRFPYYEADFGWGKPKWASYDLNNQKSTILTMTSDGEGVEVSIGLPKEEMAKFEQDPEILAYTQ